MGAVSWIPSLQAFGGNIADMVALSRWKQFDYRSRHFARTELNLRHNSAFLDDCDWQLNLLAGIPGVVGFLRATTTG